MAIMRVEFLGFTVTGPRNAPKSSFKPSDWPNWTASVKGQAIILEGEGRVIEVPRGRCVITSTVEQAEGKAAA